MKKVTLTLTLSTLLVACGGGSSNGTNDGNAGGNTGGVSESLTGIQRNHDFYSNFLGKKNGENTILYTEYTPNHDPSLDKAKISSDGNSINIYGRTIDISKAGKYDDIEVVLGDSIKKHFNFLMIKGISKGTDPEALESFVMFITGKTTENMPKSGSFIYKFDVPVIQDGISVTDHYPHIYNVDFTAKKITANSKYEKLEATIYGNTFKSDDWVQYSNNSQENRSYMAGAFYGPNAEEMAGFRQEQELQNGKWEPAYSAPFVAKKQ